MGSQIRGLPKRTGGRAILGFETRNDLTILGFGARNYWDLRHGTTGIWSTKDAPILGFETRKALVTT
jgi:hypothetical protein